MDGKGATSRKRIEIACEECRRGKRKCGGQKPSCDLCTKAGRNCTYHLEKVSRKRKYWDEDYVHNLEDQVELLQQMLKEAQSKKGSLHDDISDRNNDNHELEENSLTINESRSNQAMDELSSLMLNMGIGDDREPSFTIPPSALMFGEKPTSPSSQVVEDAFNGVSNPPECLHNYGRLQNLLRLFSELFLPFHPVIELNTANELQSMCFSKNLNVRMLGIAICAVGSYFEDLSQPTKITSTELLGYAEELVKIRWTSFPSEMLIKACSLLAWLHSVHGNDFMAWQYITLATSSILLAGIHVTTMLEQKEDVDRVPVSTLDKSRIRTFWTYYSIDKMVTALLGMNCTIPWRRVRVPPFASILEDKTIDDVAFDHQCRLWHLWDSSMDQFYAFEWVDMTIEEKDCLLIKAHQSLTSFYKEADPRLNLKKNEVEPSAIYFHIAYQTALILMHRPFLNTPTKSTTFRLAVRSVTTAASSISRLIRHFQKYHSFKIAPPQVINNILSAAVIHLLNATSGKTTTLGRQSTHGLRACMSALEELLITWPVRVQKSIQLAQELAQRWNVLWAMPIRLSNPVATGEIRGNSMTDVIIGAHAQTIGQDLGVGWPTVPDFWDNIENFQADVEIDILPSVMDAGQGGLNWLFENNEAY